MKISLNKKDHSEEDKFSHLHQNTLGFVKPELRSEFCRCQLFPKKDESSIGEDKFITVILATCINATSIF